MRLNLQAFSEPAARQAWPSTSLPTVQPGLPTYRGLRQGARHTCSSGVAGIQPACSAPYLAFWAPAANATARLTASGVASFTLMSHLLPSTVASNNCWGGCKQYQLALFAVWYYTSTNTCYSSTVTAKLC